MENLIVHNDSLCRIRVRGNGEPASEDEEIHHAVMVPGLGWVEAVLIRDLGGCSPAVRGEDRRAIDRSDHNMVLGHRP